MTDFIIFLYASQGNIVQSILKTRDDYMNSTNLDFIGLLKYNFSNITKIRLHFLQLWRASVFKYFSYFRLRNS